MTPIDTLLDRLDGVTGSGPQYRSRCPAHGSKGGTLSIKEGSDGTVLLHCFAGCSAQEIVESAGLTLGDLFPERLHSHATPGTRPRIDYRGVLQALIPDAHILAIVLQHVARGEPILGKDVDRAAEAYRNIWRVLSHNGVEATR